MEAFFGALFLLFMIALVPILIVYGIRQRKKNTAAKQQAVEMLAKELGGQYSPGGDEFLSAGAGLFYKAPMRQIINFDNFNPKGTFFVMHPFTNQGNRPHSHKFIAHRMYYTIPLPAHSLDHVYFSSSVTDYAKNKPGGLISNRSFRRQSLYYWILWQ